MANWNAIKPEEGSRLRLDAKRLEIFERVCAYMADDGLSLRQACKQPDTDTKPSTVLWWISEDEDKGEGLLAEHYARALNALGQHWADEVLECADDIHEDANSRRVRVDARKWLASKLFPKRYGDSVKVSGDAGAPIRVVVSPDDAKL